MDCYDLSEAARASLRDCRSQNKWGLGMTIFNDVAAPKWSKSAHTGTFEAMGAGERKAWSTFVRQAEIDRTVNLINAAGTYGALVSGPWGVGKTALARAVEATLSQTTHVERLFGSHAETLVTYAPLTMLMARLPATSLDSPSGIIRGIDDLIRADAAGRDVLLVVDDLPGLDTMTVGVLMHLVMGGTARLLVLARERGDLPEDLVWLVKDGLLGEIRLDYFNRDEVGELISKATGTFVSESAVTALHKASNGIPLVLQALFHEQVAKGSIRKHLGGWVVRDSLNADAGSALADVVRSRLSRENEAVRLGVEKMSLLGNTTLQMAISVLGQKTLSDLEERGFVEVGPSGLNRVNLIERHVGDIVRSRLSPERMAQLLSEIASTLDQSLESLDARETMSLAAWTLDAGMQLEPRLGLRAAVSALRQFDPVLALRCTAQIPFAHGLWVRAVQARSAAYMLLADSHAAVSELNAVPDDVVAELPIDDFGALVLTKVGALLWVSNGKERIRELLAHAEDRLAAEGARPDSTAYKGARRLVNLARFEFQVHGGDFAAVVEDLEAALADDDPDYRLNCACLLVPTLAVLGRELDAVVLASSLQTEISDLTSAPLLSDYYRNGWACALIWSGQWVACVEMLRNELEYTPQPVTYRGGLIELNLGLAQAYAGRGTKAIQVLMSAAAQLEARNSDNALSLAYTALAFCHAQVNNGPEAMEYLKLAKSVEGPALWSNGAMTEFFRFMALRWLDYPHAAEQLHRSALQDLDRGNLTTASMSLFGSSLKATEKDYGLLEEVSLRRQGSMATVNVLLAQAARTRNPNKALEAAALAQTLKLDAVESRCAVLALDLAREAGQSVLARSASRRLERLNGKLSKLPIQPQSSRAKLTQREIQVAKLAQRGMGNRAIADRIGVSVRTVEGHLYQLYSKLGVTTRQELLEDEEI